MEQTAPVGFVSEAVLERALGVLLAEEDVDRFRVTGLDERAQAHEENRIRLEARCEYAGVMATTYEWRGDFNNAEVNALHAEAFNHRILDDDWRGQVQRHSLGWVCARDDDLLVGFVNVPWDGGVHAFILDTIVSARVAGRESEPSS